MRTIWFHQQPQALNRQSDRRYEDEVPALTSVGIGVQVLCQVSLGLLQDSSQLSGIMHVAW